MKMISKAIKPALLVQFTALLILINLSLPAYGLQKDPKISPPEKLKQLHPEPQDIVPTRLQSKTAREVVSDLSNYHYTSNNIDDQLSSTFFDHYISDLDSQRLFFTSADIAGFEKFRYSLDDTIRGGNLTPGFLIFNKYQKRLHQRLLFLIDQLDKGIKTFDFTVDDEIQTDREKAPWADDIKSLKSLWRKRLKNDILNLKLSDKTDEEILAKLHKRYQNQLTRVGQTNREDTYRIYLNALTMSFDPHTQYFSPRLTENFNIQMRLSLEGIGALLQTDEEYTKVVRLVPAGPAEKSKKLSPGDRVTGVGQGEQGDIVDVVGWRIDDVVDLIRGPKNTVVRLQIIPADTADDHETKIVNIIRNTVKLEEQAAKKEVKEQKIGNNTFKIGIIDLPAFYIDFQALQSGDPNYKSTTRDVRKLLKELAAEKVDGIIIDLRNNGGGSLQEANELTGLFIKSGPTVQIRGHDGRTNQMDDPDPKIVYDGPLIVLVNRMSASASEIFAGAIQDYGRGLIIGSQTFGKGTVQSLKKLNHGQIKLTIATFYRVSGASTQHRGVIPDLVMPEIYDKDKIGESSLPEALAWDTINPVRFDYFSDLSPHMEQLKLKHNKRMQESTEFACLMEEIDFTRLKQKETNLSLKEETRKREKTEIETWRINLENKRRKVRGEEPIKSLDELEEKDTPNADKKDKKEHDPILDEAENILTDFILLQQ